MASQPKLTRAPSQLDSARPTRTDVGFLHTAEVHVASFNALAQARNLNVVHRVEETWLDQATRSGLNGELRQRVKDALLALAADCSIVICTCSTLGEVAASLQSPATFRIDQPMMDLAAVESGPVYLAYCLESTREPSGALLQSAFDRAGRNDNFAFIDCGAAWPLFEDGAIDYFGQRIAQQIIEIAQPDEAIATVVLAQASMAAAQPWLLGVEGMQSLSSPASAMDYAVNLLR